MTTRLRRPALALLVVRVALGAAFLVNGTWKLAPLDRTVGFFESVGYPAASITAALNAALEIVAGAMLILGFGVEIAAGLVLFDVAAILIPINLELGNGWWEVTWPRAAPAIALLLGGAGALSLGGPPDDA